MYVVSWDGGAVSVRDAVAMSKPLTGTWLRDAYIDTVRTLTLGLARFQGNALVIGPLELLRFGRPTVTRTSVDWPIEGGLLAERPGGHWRIQATSGRVEATLTGYLPRLPRSIYVVSHLQVHLMFTRLFLLRLRGREPLPGVPAEPSDKIRAATVDAALCYSLMRCTGGRSWRRFVAIAAVYHVACWSIAGRTLGGEVMRQRVVGVDGSRLTPGQAALRFALLPISWIAWRPLHDRIAATEVITE